MQAGIRRDTSGKKLLHGMEDFRCPIGAKCLSHKGRGVPPLGTTPNLLNLYIFSADCLGRLLAFSSVGAHRGHRGKALVGQIAALKSCGSHILPFSYLCTAPRQCGSFGLALRAIPSSTIRAPSAHGAALARIPSAAMHTPLAAPSPCSSGRMRGWGQWAARMAEQIRALHLFPCSDKPWGLLQQHGAEVIGGGQS
jgi:hypothetical protein